LNASLTMVASYRKKVAATNGRGGVASPTTPVKPPVVTPKPQPIAAPPATTPSKPALITPNKTVISTNRPNASLRPPPNSVTNKHGIITH
jgi:hypothetical protein